MKNIFISMMLVLAPLFSSAQSLRPVFVPAPAHDQYLNYNFGTVPVNFRQSVDFVLTADRMLPLHIRHIAVVGMAFNGSSNCPSILAPGRSCTIRASFWPFQEGYYSGQLNVYLEQNSIFINLSGWSRL